MKGTEAKPNEMPSHGTVRWCGRTNGVLIELVGAAN